MSCVVVQRIANLYLRIKGEGRMTLLYGKVVIEVDSAKLPMVRILPRERG